MLETLTEQRKEVFIPDQGSTDDLVFGYRDIYEWAMSFNEFRQSAT